MKKTAPWLKPGESEMLDQFNQFTLKLGGYSVKFTLSPEQLAEARNDYLWLRHAITCSQQFEQEWRNRVMWKEHLKNGPEAVEPAQVPGLGSEFIAPAVPPVPDGVIPRWRVLVNYLKNHLAYEKADGLDLGIEPVGEPAQSMKPKARCKPEGGSSVRISVRKDGHESVAAWCRRGSEGLAVKLGVYSRATFTDSRPNLVPGQPEVREYTFQYVDADALVGEVSDVCRVTTSGLQAA